MANKDNKNSTGYFRSAVDALEGMLLSLAIKDLNSIGDLEYISSRQVIVELAAGDLLPLRYLTRVIHLESVDKGNLQNQVCLLLQVKMWSCYVF